jgi:hypothetical protein
MRWVTTDRAARELDISRDKLTSRLYLFRKRGVCIQKPIEGSKRILVDIDFLLKNDLPCYTTTAEYDRVMEDIYELNEKGVTYNTMAKVFGKTPEAFWSMRHRPFRFRRKNYDFIKNKINELKAQYEA